MIIPVKCFTCGTVLGDKYRFYLQEVIKKKMAKEDDLPYDQNLTNVLRVIPGLYAIVAGVLLTGVGKYYMRQRKDHSKKWDTLTFIFGNNKCSGL